MRFIHFANPLIYIFIVLIIYFFSYIPSPLGWESAIYINTRYIHVIFAYICAFFIGCLIPFYVPFTHREPKKTKLIYNKAFDTRFFILFMLSVAMVFAQALKRGTFALLSPNKLIRSLGDQLGGYVDYPSDLITPLSIVAIFVFMATRKKIYIIYFLVAITLQLLQLNRQEVFICFFGAAMAPILYKRVTLSGILTAVGSSLISLYALIGGLQIVRHGAATISRTVSAIALPLWIIHGDLTGSMRLGHYVLDVLGPGAFGGRYSLAIFLSVVTGDNLHGAELVRVMFTDAQTAQSIGAPLSYYLDGGLLFTSAIGFVQGAIAIMIWRTAAKSGHPLWLVIYILQLLWLLWSLRSGSVTFPPTLIYQICALLFLFNGLVGAHRRGLIQLGMVSAFLATIPVSLIFMAARF